MSEPSSVRRVWSRPDVLGVEWADGSSSEFASLWLRDNLREDRDAHSGQRLTDIADLPPEPRIRAVNAGNADVTVEWESETRPGRFDLEWLAQHAPEQPSQHKPALRLWPQGAGLDARRDFAWITLTDAQRDDPARARWLAALLRDGIAFMSEVPAVESGILDAATRIGRVCETNYGLVYDVRSVAQPENLAYSDLGLGLHTDNPYREPVPGFQILHALVASPDGGESLFGDGFAIAEHLREAAPEAFERLASTAVPFHYRSRDAELYAERPLLQLTCSGELRAVHYNSRSIAPLRLAAAPMREFYGAYRRFAALLRDPRFHLRIGLRDRDLVVFDNQRTLHGRTAFSSARFARHLRGCYLTRDSVFSEAALLRRRHPREAA